MPRPVSELDTCGGGLHLVDELSIACGIAPVAPVGNTVWFELDR